MVSAGVQAALLTFGGRTADRRRRPALVIGLAIGVISLAMLAFAPNPAWFLIAMAVAGCPVRSWALSPTAIVGDVARGHHGGSVVAGFQMMSDVGSIFGPLVAGLLLDQSGFRWRSRRESPSTLLALGLAVRMPETLEAQEPEPAPQEPKSRPACRGSTAQVVARFTGLCPIAVIIGFGVASATNSLLALSLSDKEVAAEAVLPDPTPIAQQSPPEIESIGMPAGYQDDPCSSPWPSSDCRMRLRRAREAAIGSRGRR